jgi:uncharacterized protein
MHLRFIQSNFHWNSSQDFSQNDKHLRDLQSQRYLHNFTWVDEIPLEPAIHLKMFMQKLIATGGLVPSKLFFLPCDTIVDAEELRQLILSFLKEQISDSLNVLILDEVTFLKNWERTVKALADDGSLARTLLVITGSDNILIEDGAKSFPGIHRRGKNGKDITVYPLTFHEYSSLIRPDREFGNTEITNDEARLFEHYLRCGGYLSAINSIGNDGDIPESVHSVYEQWVVGDFVRKGKDRRKLFDILRVLLERPLSPLSYTTIAKESAQLSVDTAADYLHHLERLGVINCLHAIDLSTKSAHPKKDKKFHFADPFIAVSLFKMLHREGLISKGFYPKDAELVESIVVAHYVQKTSCFYLNNRSGEVDLVLLADGTPRFIEVKWKNNLDSQDLKRMLAVPQLP